MKAQYHRRRKPWSYPLLAGAVSGFEVGKRIQAKALIKSCHAEIWFERPLRFLGVRFWTLGVVTSGSVSG